MMMKFGLAEYLAPIEIEKIKILGATSKLELPIKPICRKNEANGLDWLCSLSGNS